ncbi:hypothetical protein ACFE04_023796 [Oxalis oulophora]
MQSGKTNVKKTTKGRQKIEIQKIGEKSQLQVTFSKRRGGLFKKAGELSVLSGADVAVLLFSPKDKPFFFAHPNLNTVFNHFSNENQYYDDHEEAQLSEHDIKKYNDEYEESLKVLKKLEKEKIRLCNINQKAMSRGVVNYEYWWNSDVNEDEMSFEELDEYVKALERLQGNIRRKMLNGRTDAPTAGKGGAAVGAAAFVESSNWQFGVEDQSQGVGNYDFGYGDLPRAEQGHTDFWALSNLMGSGDHCQQVYSRSADSNPGPSNSWRKYGSQTN